MLPNKRGDYPFKISSVPRSRLVLRAGVRLGFAAGERCFAALWVNWGSLRENGGPGRALQYGDAGFPEIQPKTKSD